MIDFSIDELLDDGICTVATHEPLFFALLPLQSLAGDV